VTHVTVFGQVDVHELAFLLSRLHPPANVGPAFTLPETGAGLAKPARGLGAAYSLAQEIAVNRRGGRGDGRPPRRPADFDLIDPLAGLEAEVEPGSDADW
jgi:hypothetical protein